MFLTVGTGSLWGGTESWNAKYEVGFAVAYLTKCEVKLMLQVIWTTEGTKTGWKYAHSYVVVYIAL